VNNIISSVTSALPTSKNTEEAASSTETTISEVNVSAPIVSEEEIILSKPSEEKEEVDQEQTSSTGLFKIIESSLPYTIRSTETDVISSEEPISVVEEVPSTTETTISEVNVSAPIVSEEKIILSKPSEEKEEVDQQETSSTSLFKIIQSSLPYTIRSTETDVISSEEPISVVEQDQETASSYITETSPTRDISQENLSQSIESTIETEKQEYVSNSVPDDLISSDVYHAYKEPVEPVIEEDHPSGIINKAKSIASDIISSVTSALPTTSPSEEVVVSTDTSLSNEEEVGSQSVTTIEKASEITESTISDDNPVSSTTEEKEIVVSKPTEESEIEADEVAQQPSSTGLFDIMKNLLPTAIRPKSSIITSSEEHIPTTDEDKDIVSSSVTETTTTSRVSEEYPMESSQSVTQIQQQEDVFDQISSDTTKADASHAEKEPVEEVTEETYSTSIVSKLTSAITDAISAVQHVLPTSITSSSDVQQHKASSEDDEIETSESTVSE
jgi:hypothetical protein